MARPAKSIGTQSRHNTKAEIETRQSVEKSLAGKGDKIKPPNHLTSDQADIFNFIVDGLKASGILSNLDVFVLTTCSVAIDRITQIEKMINDEPELLMNSALMASKNKYTNELFRCMNELSLSPQARSKIGSLTLKHDKEKQDPLLLVLNGEKRVKEQ